MENDIVREMQTYQRARRELESRGYLSRDLTMVLFGMAAEGLSYKQAIAGYGDFIGAAAERVHSMCCEGVLRSGHIVQPELLLTEIAEAMK